MKKRVTAVAVIAITAGAAIFVAPRNDPRPAYVPTGKQAVQAINRQRVAYGLPKLKRSLVLTIAARTWSVNLVSQGVLAHTTDLLKHYRWAGETLYRGPGGPIRPWLNSPPHRAILLNPNAELVGIGRSGDTWTGRFAAP